jgi:hypothetical protein
MTILFLLLGFMTVFKDMAELPDDWNAGTLAERL